MSIVSPQSVGPPNMSTVIRVILVNGESRSVRLDERTDVVDIVYYILSRLRADLEVAPQLFGILLHHTATGESHWLTPGYSVLDLIQSHCGVRPLEEWRFLLRIRILPQTPQHLFSQDPVSFSYYYDQILHMYLEDDSIVVDNDTALRLGCLEMRRFFRNMSQAALKKKENFAMLEKEYGFEKFFKKSFVQSAKKRNLTKLIQTTFQQYESLTCDGCIFQFFAILGRFCSLDVERFPNCAVGDDSNNPLTTTIYVGPNCDVEYEVENGERKFLVSFNDIHEIMYEPELATRGKVTIELKTSSPVAIRAAQLVTAVHLSTLIDGYCQVYTTLNHSRLSNGPSSLRNSSTIDRFMGDIQLPVSVDFAKADDNDYATIRDPDKLMKALGRPLSPQDIALTERIGEGQFGDVHKGVLYQDTTEEALVAVKTCKPDSAPEERAKFLQEAAIMKQFSHPHIIKLFGIVTNGPTTYIVMELAPLGQLRQYLILHGDGISREVLLNYIRQLCSAMVHLESKNYVHRDIAARNILLLSPDKIKLSDFGLSRWLEEADFYVASRGKLPIKWMAPESINFRRFTGSSDVWMFGVCCWEILMRGVKPFIGIKNDEVIGKLEQGERLPLPPDSPPTLFNLMRHCWQYDPGDRPSFVEIEGQLNLILQQEKQFMSAAAAVGGVRTRGYEIPDRQQQHLPVGRVPSGGPMRNLDDGNLTPPALPPRAMNMNNRPLPPEPTTSQPSPVGGARRRQNGSESNSVDPYLITTLPGATPTTTSNSTRSHSPQFSPSITSPTQQQPGKTSPIPPPLIIRQQMTKDKERFHYEMEDDVESSAFVEDDTSAYYSTVPHDLIAGKYSSTVTPERHDEVAPVSTSHNEIGNDKHLHEQEDLEDDPVMEDLLTCTTNVVRSVVDLSTKLPNAKPNDYVELVKGIGLALRELLVKVDKELDLLPEHTHHKVKMAHKVLSTDMQQLVKSMKELQENYQSFLLDHYQKQMLKSANIIAVNSKHLLEAYTTAKRNAERRR